jgi:ADP-ribose pyrophosphatase YjhB (NUDIX family)
MKLATLCYPLQEGKVLLAMKKRGFGKGKWNGPGGKVQPEETVVQACVRETFEETGIHVSALEDVGIIEFIYEGKPEWDNECHIFLAREQAGEPQETEEMAPRWFPLAEVPYPNMWEDDPIWLPGVLHGGHVNLRFYFDANGKMLRFEERA